MCIHTIAALYEESILIADSIFEAICTKTFHYFYIIHQYDLSLFAGSGYFTYCPAIVMIARKLLEIDS